MLKPMTILAVSSLIMALTACRSIEAPMLLPPTSDPTIIEAEEYVVYSALIQDEYVGGMINLAVIRSHTTIECCVSEKDMPDLTSEMISDLKAKSQHSSPLDSTRFNLSAKVVLVGTEVHPSRDDGWDAFYKDYPGSQGIMELSRVGFNAKKDKAVVYAGNMKGHLYGRGYNFLLVKRGGRWSIQDQVMVWIS